MTALPSHQDAEAAALGAAIMDAVTLRLVIDSLVDEDFYSPHHRAVFGALRSLEARGVVVDELGVIEQLRGDGKLASLPDGSAAVWSLVEKVPAIAAAPSYVAMVRDAAVRRALVEVGQAIVGMASDPQIDAEAAVTHAQGVVLGNRYLHMGRSVARAENGLQSLAGFMDLYSAVDQNHDVVPLPIPELNEPGLGMRPGEVWIFGGRSGEGKTWLLQDITETAAFFGAHTVIFEQESSKADWYGRLLAMQGLDHKKLRRREIAVGDLEPAMRWLKEHVAPRMRVVSGRQTIDSIRTELYRCRADGRPARVVGIDHMQLIRVGGQSSQDRRHSQDDVLGDLKELADELGLTVVILSQLTEVIDPKGPKYPVPDDRWWRDNKGIKFIADYAGFLHRQRDDQGRQTDDALIVMSKVRDGEPLAPVLCKWNKDGMYRFRSVAPPPKYQAKPTQETLIV